MEIPKTLFCESVEKYDHGKYGKDRQTEERKNRSNNKRGMRANSNEKEKENENQKGRERKIIE